VTFYNTANATYAYNPVNISGGGTVSFTAPQSGSMAGMLFFQDRTLTFGSIPKETLSGGSSAGFEGALYFPKSQLIFSGGSALHPDYVEVVVRLFTISGTSTINSDYANLPLGHSPIPATGIIE
jgi:hypothetical protein